MSTKTKTLPNGEVLKAMRPTVASLAKVLEAVQHNTSVTAAAAIDLNNQLSAQRDFFTNKLAELESRLDELESDVNGLEIDAEHYQDVLNSFAKQLEQINHTNPDRSPRAEEDFLAEAIDEIREHMSKYKMCGFEHSETDGFRINAFWVSN